MRGDGARRGSKGHGARIEREAGNLRGIVWVGVVLFLLGLATLFYPPLKLIVGSVTTSCAMIGGGLALMVLPSMVVGNELLILGCVLGLVAERRHQRQRLRQRLRRARLGTWAGIGLFNLRACHLGYQVGSCDWRDIQKNYAATAIAKIRWPMHLFWFQIPGAVRVDDVG